MRASRRVGWMPTFNQWPIGRQSQRQAVLPQHDGRHEKPIAAPGSHKCRHNDGQVRDW